jgi:Outer membrane protein beta-barrel domain
MFKKMFAVAVLLIAGTTAMAEDRLTLGYRYDDFVGSTVTQKAYVINYDTRVNPKLQLGLGVRLIERDSTSASTNNRLTNRWMLRANYEVNDYVYVNSAIGTKKQSLKPTTEFWQTEVGVKYKVNDQWQLRAGYKYREGFNGKADDYYQGPAYRVQYTINPRYNVSFTFEDLEFLNEDRKRYQIAFQKRLF